jgi:hypothetical protein
MVRVFYDDKRFIGDSEHYVVERFSMRQWRYCKYCYQETPQFVLLEHLRETNRTSATICCWECGAGLQGVNDPRLQDVQIAHLRRT